MKIYSAEAVAEIEAGTALVSGAAWFGGDDPIGLWSGDGPLAFSVNGVNRAFIGIGERALAGVAAGALGGAEQGISLTLSGIDADVAGQLDLDSLRGLPVILWRLVFNGTGARLLDARVHLRGRVDTAPLEDQIGGASTLTINIEGAARGQGRRSERMRTDADQRLISATDTGLSRVSYAGEKTIYAGGKPPERAGTALGGVSAGQAAALSLMTKGVFRGA
ncbi:hypothetical protein [Brevundimonas sp. Bb-A]|jgi:hypothetical protein|uniref:hypothetical protein n=1 Tax=Brevundimonas sp. Bb-A TaxID=2560058 RepID=UPI00128F0800|nr:hypothetical protein [Brevundimonas sp. Bb-A]QFU30273.1 hypothetical protein BSP_01220 [Brevundimonas sp. Bb-A]